MRLHNPGSEVYVPDGLPAQEALARTTHMSIAAHQDDIEIMAYHGILECFGKPDKHFTGVTVTNGAGSQRDGIYAHYTDDEMRRVRRSEQKKAAVVGEYAAQIFLDYASDAVKSRGRKEIIEDLRTVVRGAKPQVIYTHNPADKHDTHVATALRTIEALRELPAELRPQHLYGCEVWRGLDWLNDADKVVFNVEAHENIAMALMGVFDSQICGGKRYDLATLSRRRANATYFESHEVDVSTALIFGMDLTPLITDPSLDVARFAREFIARFSQDVTDRITRVS
jgi:LmbE family N-acetylglucosaminyl deacetylase